MLTLASVYILETVSSDKCRPGYVEMAASDGIPAHARTGLEEVLVTQGELRRCCRCGCASHWDSMINRWTIKKLYCSNK